MRIFPGNLPYPLKVMIAEEDTEPTPEALPHESGGFKIFICSPPLESGNLAVGRFVNEFSKLEDAMRMTLSFVTSTPLSHVFALSHNLGMRGVSDTIRALVPRTLGDTAAFEIDALLDRIKEKNTQRNNMLHGHWVLEILPIDANGTPKLHYQVVREYPPSDPKKHPEINDRRNRSVRRKYLYTPQRIEAITASISEIVSDLMKFNGTYCSGSGPRGPVWSANDQSLDPSQRQMATDQSQSNPEQSIADDPS